MNRIALPLAPALLFALSGAAFAAELAPEDTTIQAEDIGHKDGRRGGGSSTAPRAQAPAAPAPAAQPTRAPAAPAAQPTRAPAAAPAAQPTRAPAAPAPAASRPTAPAPAASAPVAPSRPTSAAPVAPSRPTSAAPTVSPVAPSRPTSAAPTAVAPSRPAVSGTPAAPEKAGSSANPWQMQPAGRSSSVAPAAPTSRAAPTLGAPTRPSASLPNRSSFNGGASSAPAMAMRATSGGPNTAHTRPPTAPGNPSDRPAHYSGGSRAESTPAHHTRPAGSGPNVRPAHVSHVPARAHSRAVYHARPYTPAHRWYHGHYRPYHPARPVHWYHGVFVYGPAPHHHGYYVAGGGSATATVAAEAPDMPKRKVDRNNAFAIGARGGSYFSSYDQGGAFSDAGVGLTARYRPVEAVGLELAYTYYDDTFDTDSERATSTFQPSVQVFAAPWSRVSPYVLVGATYARRDYNDTWSDGLTPQHTSLQDSAWGPHAGLGIEFALGQSAAIDIEGRYVGFLNVGGEDPNFPAALQGSAGLNFYF